MSSKSGATAIAVPKQTFCWALNETICDFTTDPANADQVFVVIGPRMIDKLSSLTDMLFIK